MVGLAILVFIVIAGGITAHFLLKEKPSPEPGQASSDKAENHSSDAVSAPIFEIYTEVDPPRPPAPAPKPIPREHPPKKPAPIPTPKPKPIPAGRLPRIAILIDDMGYDRGLARKFFALDASITYAILPYGPFSKEIAGMAHGKGLETMLHLPMEPKEYPRVDPGPGALLTSMTPDELITQLTLDLNAIPYITGVNNHMGSRMTADSSRMKQIFSILKKRNYFYIDSRTTSNTRCEQSARLLRIPFAQRDIFLDHDRDPLSIQRQVDKLLKIAVREGQAVGIGHPVDATYTILRDNLSKIKAKASIVSASEIVDVDG